MASGGTWLCGCGSRTNITGNLAVSEKDQVRAEDIESIILSAPGATNRRLSRKEIRALIDCDGLAAITMTGGLNPVTMSVVFKCPEFVHDIEVLGRDTPADTCATTAAQGTWNDIVGDYSAVSPEVGTIERLDVPRAFIKQKIGTFAFSFDGTSQNGDVVVTLCGLVIRTYGQKETYSPRYQPANVRRIDRVLIEDIQAVFAIRGGAPSLVVKLTDGEVRALFDGSKDTCVSQPSGFPINGSAWQAGDAIVVVFKEPQQVHTIEVAETINRAVDGFTTQMSSSILGLYTWAYTDANLANGDSVDDVSEAIVNAKISAFQFVFSLNFLGGPICEIVVKTFDHVENKPPPAISFELSDTAGATDTAVDFTSPFGSQMESKVVQLANDSTTEDILITFRLVGEAAAPATGTAFRTLTLMAGEFKSMDAFRVLGLKHKRAGAVDAALRISAW